MTRVLLVTGARSLADSRDAERWARALIAEALRDVDLLIVGDADGPDAWAWAEAGCNCVECHEYITRGPRAGMIAEHRGIGVPRIDRPWSVDHTSPLRRNAAMARDCKRLAAEGATVSVLALLDGRKPAVTQPGEKRPTRGTEHTVGLARAAGLSVREERWPPAPKGTP